MHDKSPPSSFSSPKAPVCMALTPQPPPPPHHTHTNTLIEPASGLELPRLGPPCMSASAGSFPQQIPLVTFLLARCNKAFQDRCFPSPFNTGHLSPSPLCHCPALLCFIPPPFIWPLICLKKKKKKKKISYLRHHCQVSTENKLQ